MVENSVAARYRKRASDIGRKLKGTRGKAQRVALERKKKALEDMAANEDWLAGTPQPPMDGDSGL